MSEQLSAPAAGGQGAEVTPSSNPQNPAPGNPAEAPKPFWSDFKNPELRGYLEKKQFADPEILADSYRNLEKFHGVPQDRLIKLPESMDDAEALKPIYEKLGLAAPATPEAYGFADIEGADPEFSKTAAGWMHEIGLPEKFAKPLAERWQAYVKAQEGAVMQQATEQAAVEMGQLQAEWGASFNDKLEAARRAARQFGWTEEELSDLETNIGPAQLYKRFQKMGERLGEASFVEGDKKPGAFQSPESAKAEIANLIKDQDFQKRIKAGDQAAKDRWNRLHLMAYPQTGG